MGIHVVHHFVQHNKSFQNVDQNTSKESPPLCYFSGSFLEQKEWMMSAQSCCTHPVDYVSKLFVSGQQYISFLFKKILGILNRKWKVNLNVSTRNTCQITLVKLNGRTTKGWIVQSSMLSRVEKHDQKYLKMWHDSYKCKEFWT